MKTVVSVLLMLAAVSVFGAGGGGGGGGGGGSSSGGMGGGGPTAQTYYDAGYKLSQGTSPKYEDAIVQFKKAISMNSGYAEAYNMLGFCTRKLGNVSEAFTYYEKALQLKPNFPEAREYYGEAYLQAGDLTKAVQQYVILQKAGSKYAKELLEDIDAYVNK